MMRYFMKKFFICFYFSLFILFLIKPASGTPVKVSSLSDTLDALYYRIHIQELNFQAKSITVYTQVTLRSKVNNLDHIVLEMMDLNVDSVFVEGAVNTFNHINPRLVIPLKDPLNINEEVEVVVYYHGVPFHEDWGGFHWAGEYAFNLGVGFESIPHNLGKTWFPCIDDFIDRAVYEVFVTIPYSKKAICGGLLQSVTDNGNGTHTFHWKINAEIPTYLASIAAGMYARVSDTIAGMSGNIPVEIYTRPADSVRIAGTFVNLPAMITHFEDCFGPYRWERVGYTGAALGAMEHATNIFVPHGTISGNTSNDDLMAHELSHAWFGNLITCETAEDMWINEGWAVFCESVFQEGLYGREAYKQNIREKHRNVLQFSHIDDGGYYPLYPMPQEITYGTTTYQKGGSVVHTLRNYLGDEVFFDAVKALLNMYQFSDVSSGEMRDFFTSYSGIGMNDFFDAWVFTEGFPHFSVDSVHVTNTGGQWQADVRIRQKHKGNDAFAASNKVEIAFINTMWDKETRMIEFSGETGEATFSLPFNPVAWFVDPDDKICDATTDFDKVLKTTGEHNYPETFAKLTVQNLVDSAWVRVTHNWVSPDPLITPVEGLTLSDYRYWTVSGIIPEGFLIRGTFQYNRFGYLDNNLITNTDDSLVILYRPGAGHEWQSIDFEKYGSPYTGNMYVDNLQTGEYTLAVWDQLYVKVPESTSGEIPPMKIYPNPSDTFNISLNINELCEIQVTDSAGRKLDRLMVRPGQNLMTWKPENLLPGSYIVQLINVSGEIITQQKIIVK